MKFNIVMILLPTVGLLAQAPETVAAAAMQRGEPHDQYMSFNDSFVPSSPAQQATMPGNNTVRGLLVAAGFGANVSGRSSRFTSTGLG